VNAAGVATLPWKWSTKGKWRIVASAPATPYYTQGTSRAITVTVT
jgi:hypothetical protein